MSEISGASHWGRRFTEEENFGWKSDKKKQQFDKNFVLLHLKEFPGVLSDLEGKNLMIQVKCEPSMHEYRFGTGRYQHICCRAIFFETDFLNDDC